MRAATAERERLLAETNRTRALLRAALETLGDDAGDDEPAQAA